MLVQNGMACFLCRMKDGWTTLGSKNSSLEWHDVSKWWQNFHSFDVLYGDIKERDVNGPLNWKIVNFKAFYCCLWRSIGRVSSVSWLIFETTMNAKWPLHFSRGMFGTQTERCITYWTQYKYIYYRSSYAVPWKCSVGPRGNTVEGEHRLVQYWVRYIQIYSFINPWVEIMHCLLL